VFDFLSNVDIFALQGDGRRFYKLMSKHSLFATLSCGNFGSSKISFYSFFVISFNGHNSSQEQDRDMLQETFFVHRNMLAHMSIF